MNFTCDRQTLLDALTIAGRATSTRTTMPILECVLLTVDTDKGITLLGNDRELCIETTPLKAEVEEGGAIALNAKLFTEIVRKLPGESINIKTDENFKATCKSGRSSLNIPGLPADDFPQLPTEEIDKVDYLYKIKASALKDLIRQTIFSVSLDHGKKILTGELVEVKNDLIQFVAIDMFRISYKSEALDEGVPESKAVIPARSLHELSRILPDGMVNFFFTEKRAVFEAEGFKLVSSLLFGDFIRHDQIFNEDFSTMVVIDKQSLLSAFERIMLMSGDNRSITARIDITDDDMKIAAQSDKGDADDGLPCSTDGKDLTIFFNPRYFIEALRVIDDAKVNLKFNTTMSPCTITGSEPNCRYKYLIVPLRPPA